MQQPHNAPLHGTDQEILKQTSSPLVAVSTATFPPLPSSHALAAHSMPLHMIVFAVNVIPIPIKKPYTT